MKLVELQVANFVNEVDSKRPAPGGGSVAALASTLGVALTRMVGHVSIGKKKFKALDESTQKEFNQVINEFETIKEELLLLVDKDTEAFNLIMEAFKLPKETIEEKKVRAEKIEEGTLEAIKVPFKVAQLSLEALLQLHIILKNGNKNAISDLGVSALMLHAGLEGSLLNVKINIPGISDEKLKDKYIKESQEILEKGRNLKNNILDSVNNNL